MYFMRIKDTGMLKSKKVPKKACYKAEELRLNLVPIARLVDETARSIDVGQRAERPHYVMDPADRCSPRELQQCVPVTPEEIRKAWTDVRALMRLDGLKFVLVVDGEPLVVIRKHPAYTPEAALRLRNIATEKGAAAREQTLANQITELLKFITEFGQRLDRFDARLDQIAGLQVKSRPAHSNERSRRT
jgi:hypothetical protein